MKIGKKTVTRELFATAVLTARAVVQSLHPRTRLAYYCETFLDVNKKAIKEHEKEGKSRTKKLQNELRDFTVDHAVERDGVLVTDEKSNEFKFGRDGEKKVSAKKQEIDEKIEAINDEYVKEFVEIKIIKDTLQLPEKIAYDIEKNLNGLVFNNKSEFSEEIIEEADEV